MIKLILTYPLFLSLLLFTDIKSQEFKENECSESKIFTQYLNTFNKITLPFKMDRKAVFNLKNNDNSFYKIKGNLNVFIPDKLKQIDSNSVFKSLYILPNQDEITSVIIMQDFINKYGFNVINTHIITYNKKGEIIDFKELAGFSIDAWEAYLEINSEYKIERKFYQYKLNTDKNNSKFFRLVETISEYMLNSNGMIEEINKEKREGYFVGDWTGYTFIKPIQ